MSADLREARARQQLPPCVIREMRPEDRGFIVGHFLKSAHSAYAYRNMPVAAFQHYGARMIDVLLDRCQVLVVSAKSDPDTLIGFAVSERPFRKMEKIVLHFIYVKYDFREQGLASAVMRALGHDAKNTVLFATHMTVAWFHVGPRFGAVHNPFFLWPEFHNDKESAG